MKSFAEGCTKGDTSHGERSVAFCSCAGNELQRTMPARDFLTLSLAVNAAGSDRAKKADLTMGDERVRHAFAKCLDSAYTTPTVPSNVKVAASAGKSATKSNFYSFVKGAISGAHQRLDIAYSLNPDCSSLGYPVVHVKREPANGRIIGEPGTGYPNFPKDNVRHVCNAKQVPLTVIYYDSRAGFVGTDSATIEIIFPSGTLSEVEYKINVR